MPSAAATRSRKLHGWLAIAIAAMTHASATCQALSLESFMIRLILGSALPFVAAVLLGRAAGSKVAPAPSCGEADSCSEPGATRIEPALSGWVWHVGLAGGERAVSCAAGGLRGSSSRRGSVVLRAT